MGEPREEPAFRSSSSQAKRVRAVMAPTRRRMPRFAIQFAANAHHTARVRLRREPEKPIPGRVPAWSAHRSPSFVSGEPC